MFHEACSWHKGKDSMGPCLDWETDWVRSRETDRDRAEKDKGDAIRDIEGWRESNLEIEKHRDREWEGDREVKKVTKAKEEKERESSGKQKQRETQERPQKADWLAFILWETGVFK